MSDNSEVSKNTKVTKSEGNTNPRFTKVCLTLNNYSEEDFTNLLEECRRRKYKFIIGKEVGESGTKHLQGYIELGKQLSLKQLKELNDKAHWEKARGNRDQNFIYCSKDGQYETNLKKPEEEVEEEWEMITELRDWQHEVIKRLMSQDNRKILWVWEKKGRVGKSSLARYMAINHGALVLSGKAHDIKNGVANFITDKNKKKKHIFIFDFCRTIEDYVSYQGIEDVKNGLFYSGKYEGCMVLFNYPRLVCFANFEPDYAALSEDRWDVMAL